MFDRWRQENFFKYLREEFALDALVDYGTEPADANRDVPNPERNKINAQWRKANVHLEQLQARGRPCYGQRFLHKLSAGGSGGIARRAGPGD